MRLPISGLAELALAALVMAAAWTRTPVGALGTNAWALASGGERVDMLAAFRLDLGDELALALERALSEPSPDQVGGWTTPWRAAVQAQLGDSALAEIDALDLDDPQVALETWVLGEEVRDRAIARAKAAGARPADAFDQYKPFLPDLAARRAEAVRTNVLALTTAMDLRWPVDPEVRVSSPFGYRHHPTLKRRKFHKGVDIAVPTGTPIAAAGAGRVVRATEDKVNGKYVIVDHGHGVRTAYCHGSELHVREGQRVDQGELVMASGNTGRSSGPHLHFGLRVHGQATDPGAFRTRGASASGALVDGGSAAHEAPEPEALSEQEDAPEHHDEAELTEVEHDGEGTSDVAVDAPDPEGGAAEDLVGAEEAGGGDGGHAADGDGPSGPGLGDPDGDAVERSHAGADSGDGDGPDAGAEHPEEGGS